MTRRTRVGFHAMISVAPLLLGASPVGAQGRITIECRGDLIRSARACRGIVQGADSLQSKEILVQVVRDGVVVDGAVVIFRTETGIVLPDSTATDTHGFARTLWLRPSGATAAAVAIEAISSGESAVQFVQLDPNPGDKPQELALVPWDGIGQTWFEKSPLLRPVRLQVRTVNGLDTAAVTDVGACSAQRVAFTTIAGGGTATPDTASGRIDGDACFVGTDWTLAAGIGDRHLRATLISAAGYRARHRTVQIRATARALPRIIGGVAYGETKSYLGVKAGTKRTIRVERLLPDDTKLAYDSVVTSASSVDSVPGEGAAAAFIGLSTPFIPRWRWLAVTVGLDLANPRDDWYGGMSLTRPFGLGTEALPIDIHGLLHWGRDAILKDADQCAVTGECDTEKKTRFQGAAFLLSVDAGSIFAELIKRLMP